MNKIAIIGRGSLALLTTLEIHKKFKNAELYLYGEHEEFSASYAAGAMINILSEIDCFNIDHPLSHWKLHNRSKAIKAWDELNKSLFKDGIVDKSIIKGTGTEISISADSENIVEKNSFQAINNAASSFNISIHQNEKLPNTLFIEDEKSVDSKFLLESIEKYLLKNINFITKNIVSIYKCPDEKLVLKDSKNEETIFDKVIIACGAWSEKLIDASKNINKPKIKSFFGVGSALLIKSEMPYLDSPTINKVIRTPNRGGTCGIHALQREDSIYIGASSHVTNLPLKYPKCSSIHNLIEGSETLLSLDTYQLGFEIVTGYRPITSDTVPIIGSLAKNLFCIYGTKRDGFTWAPFFSKCIANQLNGEINNEWTELLKLCSPERSLISAGDVEECIESFILNKKFEYHQHNKNLSVNQLKKFKEIAQITHQRFNQNQALTLGLNPELINILYYTNQSI